MWGRGTQQAVPGSRMKRGRGDVLGPAWMTARQGQGAPWVTATKVLLPVTGRPEGADLEEHKLGAQRLCCWHGPNPLPVTIPLSWKSDRGHPSQLLTSSWAPLPLQVVPCLPGPNLFSCTAPELLSQHSHGLPPNTLPWPSDPLTIRNSVISWH